MTVKYLKSTDIVLELGGSCGRNSCIINYILENKSNHVVIEPSINEIYNLENNKLNNNFKFHIENSAISNKQLYSLGWNTYDYQIKNSKPVNIINYEKLLNKYKLKFNVLIIDMEGNFVEMLKSFNNILDNIRLLIIEHDFKNIDDYEYFKYMMNDKNFKIVDKYFKGLKFAPDLNWIDGLKEDNIFVSVWKKN